MAASTRTIPPLIGDRRTWGHHRATDGVRPGVRQPSRPNPRGAAADGDAAMAERTPYEVWRRETRLLRLPLLPGQTRPPHRQRHHALHHGLPQPDGERNAGAGDSRRSQRTGSWLDGGKTYRLTVPKDVPVAQFWSVTVYDNETRCFVDTGGQPDRSSRDAIATNPDGSVDIFFGRAAPAGKPESNWIQTLPGKGWFTYCRFYGPTKAYFDRLWMLPDIEPVN